MYLIYYIVVGYINLHLGVEAVANRKPGAPYIFETFIGYEI